MKQCQKCGAMLALVEGYEWTMTGFVKSEPREVYHECGDPIAQFPAKGVIYG